MTEINFGCLCISFVDFELSYIFFDAGKPELTNGLPEAEAVS